MSMRKIVPAALLAFTLVLTLGTAHAADTPKLGKPISEADIKAWDITDPVVEKQLTKVTKGGR